MKGDKIYIFFFYDLMKNIIMKIRIIQNILNKANINNENCLSTLIFREIPVGYQTNFNQENIYDCYI